MSLAKSFILTIKGLTAQIVGFEVLLVMSFVKQIHLLIAA
ncbi:hypothetical protein PTET_a3160 [Pseudoalteromonas tetraodonis]|nr:hypothetical protein PSM_A2763 [Pseudoalteromonas sp. SM9913]ATD04394.1 hypothetical protein PTET_a3160 [Pseudoalteromonas tetraodonis]